MLGASTYKVVERAGASDGKSLAGKLENAIFPKFDPTSKEEGGGGKFIQIIREMVKKRGEGDQQCLYLSYISIYAFDV